MQQRLSFVTLAVADLDASRRFYVEGLGWTPCLQADDVLMFQVADRVVLSLWDRAAFAAEVGEEPAVGVAPITLAHNVPTGPAVTAVLDTARAAGASRVWEAEDREWGGFSGYFADPDGYRWEVAWNPHPVGRIVVP
ncbi:MAG: VOC family protein [Thermoleophilia bacterium]|nr:VOC family protein [Thermoleophilia bacterium]